MLKSYAKIALRNLGRHKGYTAINLTGLAVGLAVCLVIGLFVQFKLSYDRFHADSDRIYRLRLERYSSGGEAEFTSTASGPMLPAALSEAPQIEVGTRLFRNPVSIKFGDITYFEEQTLFVDASFFDVFSFQTVSGDLNQALISPDSLVMRNWRVEEFETPTDAMFMYGADWGFSVDPTCLVRLWVDDDARRIYIDHEAWQVRCEIEDIPALFDTVPGSRDWLIVADSQRPDTISYMQGQGFQIWPAKKGAGSVEDGIEFVNSYETVIHPRCKHTIDEFGSYRYKLHPQTNEVTPKIEDKNNHTCDAVRYALESMRWARAGVW